jgi:hypothetical protein
VLRTRHIRCHPCSVRNRQFYLLFYDCCSAHIIALAAS